MASNNSSILFFHSSPARRVVSSGRTIRGSILRHLQLYDSVVELVLETRCGTAWNRKESDERSRLKRHHASNLAQVDEQRRRTSGMLLRVQLLV
jgi:hypothetical protein